MSRIGMVNFWNGKRRRENEVRKSEPEEKLLRKKDVVNRLALSPRSVDRLVAGQQLTKVKLMGAVRFKESEVMALINGEAT